MDGRKRRSPSSYRGKASKMSRPGGIDGLFGNGSDSGGILASGSESPKQVGVPLTSTGRAARIYTRRESYISDPQRASPTASAGQ